MPPPRPDSPPPDLYVGRIRGMGRGVFAGRAFKRREVIEVCPVIRLATDTAPDGLEDYVFRWGAKEDELALALGLGSLYNHSATPNAEFSVRLRSLTIAFRALRDIAAGEQILIDYQWDAEDYAAFVGVPPAGK
jgi:uncharacterized protein